jgi:AraC family transcriptional regulator
LILTSMPDLPPRPETPANASFRRDFYRRWGREWCVVAGSARHAEYEVYEQALSVKMVSAGREHYFVDRRRITVTPNDYLVLNEGRRYGSLLESPQGATSFCLFYPFGAAERCAREMSRPLAQTLDAPEVELEGGIAFSENLRPHDSLVSPVLRYIRREIERGTDDETWLGEQLHYLLVRLLRSEALVAALPERLDCARAATRKELVRRLGWAVDFMRSNLHEELSLERLAQAARLSSYHFLRMFRQVYGTTPVGYLRELRTQRAMHLLDSTTLEVNEIAAQVGMTRLSLWRAVRRERGTCPSATRRLAAVSPS